MFWLIAGCLTFSHKYVMLIHDENRFNYMLKLYRNEGGGGKSGQRLLTDNAEFGRDTIKFGFCDGYNNEYVYFLWNYKRGLYHTSHMTLSK